MDCLGFEKGQLYDYGCFKLLNLHGSWKEMGRQYGHLGSRQIHDVLDYLRMKTDGSPEKALAVRRKAELVFSRYPQYLRDFLSGEAETSGLDEKELILANAVEYAEEDFFCSGFAAWGDYAKDKLLYGRNYDACSYIELNKDIFITVFHPDDGSLATSTIGYAGELYTVNSLNEKGLFIALNNGMPSAGFDIHFEMDPSTVDLFSASMRARDVDDMDEFLRSTRSFASFIIGVADKNESRSYEWCYDGVERSDQGKDAGKMIITNHYVNENWPYPTPDDEHSWDSITRRRNLEKLAGLNKGQIDARRMMSIMQTPMEEGGPEHVNTRFQLVVEPETLTVWIRIIRACDWTRLDMGDFLLEKN